MWCCEYCEYRSVVGTNVELGAWFHLATSLVGLMLVLGTQGNPRCLKIFPSHRPAFRTISRENSRDIGGERNSSINNSSRLLTLLPWWSRWNPKFVHRIDFKGLAPKWPFASDKSKPLKKCLKSISIFWIFLRGRVSTKAPRKTWWNSCYQGHAFRIHFQLLKPWMVGASFHVGCLKKTAVQKTFSETGFR